MKYLIKNETEIPEFIQSQLFPLILESINSVDNDLQKAIVISMIGDLGSGKTTFTKYFAEILGIPKEQIISPTFVIQKRFELNNPPSKFSKIYDFKNLYHLDVYRTDSAKEISNLGWQELISKSENIVLVEWADKIAEILPSDTIKLQFKFIDENTREIEIIKETKK